MKVAVIGAGTMGSGIAQAFAQTEGYEVILTDINLELAQRGQQRVAKGLQSRVDRGKMEQAAADQINARIKTGVLEGCGDCDLVVEAVLEEMSVKKETFKALDAIAKPECIFASNTSSLSITEIARGLNHPLVGMHFFNPAPMMSLVEIVRPLTASDETVAAVTEFARTCGKDPVEVKDRAGFIVNALLFPYLNNAVRMLENGTASRDDIDTAMKGGCNFPMGPLALLDLVGLDTSLSILDALYAEFRDPNYAAVPALRRMVTAGQLGRKSGMGFYDYAKK